SNLRSLLIISWHSVKPSAKKFLEASCGAKVGAYLGVGGGGFLPPRFETNCKFKALEEFSCDSVHCTTALSCAASRPTKRRRAASSFPIRPRKNRPRAK